MNAGADGRFGLVDASQVLLELGVARGDLIVEATEAFVERTERALKLTHAVCELGLEVAQPGVVREVVRLGFVTVQELERLCVIFPWRKGRIEG